MEEDQLIMSCDERRGGIKEEGRVRGGENVDGREREEETGDEKRKLRTPSK